MVESTVAYTDRGGNGWRVSDEGKSPCCGCGGEDEKRTIDWLLWGSALVVVVALVFSFIPNLAGFVTAEGAEFCESVRELFGKMWWGIILGLLAVGVLQFVPQRAVSRLLGDRGDFLGMVRAVLAGVVLDVCSHGILLVSMQLYRRGLSIGQTVAFLVASPWNSFSLTLILVSLIGLGWTVSFIGLSLVVALMAGLLFSWFARRGWIPANPHKLNLEDSDNEPGFLAKAKTSFAEKGWAGIAISTFNESRMILRWILFGIVLASVIRMLFDPAVFADWFGPTIAGLLLTVVAATVIEVCSEGSSPIAADLLTRAGAPGNSFAFLMAGVATDYTEIMAVKETTASWKIALLIPAFSLPQIVLIAWLLNRLAAS